MGATVDSFSDSFGFIAARPTVAGVIAVLGVAAGVVSFGLNLVGAFIPIIGIAFQLITGIVVVPLFLCAVLGLVAGTARGADLTEAMGQAVSKRGLQTIGAFAIWQVAVFAFTIGIGVLAAVVGAFASASLPADPSSASGLADGAGIAILGLFVVFVLVVLVVGIFLQFLDVVVVLGGASAIEAYPAVFGFVRDAPVSVFGYTLARFGIGIIPIGFGVVAAAVLDTAGAGGLASFAVVGLVAFVLYLVASVFSLVFHAAYHQRRTGTPIA